MKKICVFLLVTTLVFLCGNTASICKKKNKKTTDSVVEIEGKKDTMLTNSKIVDNYNSLFKVERTDIFFTLFIAKREKPKRDEFETIEEYEKRMPKPFDSTQILYFVVEKNAKVGYSYNIDSKILYIYSGEITNYGSLSKYYSNGAYPMVIKTDVNNLGDYEASNAYGKAVAVHRTMIIDYVFYFVNQNKFPQTILNSDRTSFAITCNKEPKEAKRISENYELIIAVKLNSYEHSNDECLQILNPTLTEPRQLSRFTRGIDAKLMKLILWDKGVKEIIEEIVIEN